MASEPAPPLSNPSTFDSVHDDLVKKYEDKIEEKDIVRLYATNIVLSRLRLFTHHIRLTNTEPTPKVIENKYRDNFRTDLSRYSSAIAEYKSISESLDFDSALHLEAIRNTGNSHLSKVACCIVTMEQYEQQVAKATGEELAKLEDLRTTMHESFRNMLSGILSDSEALAKKSADEKENSLFYWKWEKLAFQLALVFFSGLTLISPVLIKTFRPKVEVVLLTMTASVLIICVLVALVMR